MTGGRGRLLEGVLEWVEETVEADGGGVVNDEVDVECVWREVLRVGEKECNDSPEAMASPFRRSRSYGIEEDEAKPFSSRDGLTVCCDGILAIDCCEPLDDIARPGSSRDIALNGCSKLHRRSISSQND
jgi:hypothetical protein